MLPLALKLLKLSPVFNAAKRLPLQPIHRNLSFVIPGAPIIGGKSLLDYFAKIEALDAYFKPTEEIQPNVYLFPTDSGNRYTKVLQYLPQKIATNNKNRPSAFYLSGSAFIHHDPPKILNSICATLASIGECQVFAILHRLGPENPFPFQHLDVLQALNTLITDPDNKDLGVGDNNILIGYSSGANLAIQVAQSLIASKFPIKKGILVSPLLDLSRTILEITEFAEETQQDKVIPNEYLKWISQFYKPQWMRSLNNPEISPAFRTAAELKGLMPTEIWTGAFDATLPDAHRLYRTLRQAKAKTKLHIVDKAGHAMWWREKTVVESVAKSIHAIFTQQEILHKNGPIHVDLKLSQPISREETTATELPSVDKNQEQSSHRTTPISS